MYFDKGPEPSLGLLHVLEDATVLLKGGTLAPNRRGYVLDQVRSLFDEAQEGSELGKQQGLFVQPSKWRALESYTLLSRYLGEESYQADEAALGQILGAVRHLSTGQIVPENVRISASTTLESLCEKMSRDVSQGITPSEELIAVTA